MTARSNRTRALLILFGAMSVVAAVPIHAADAGDMASVNPATLKYEPIPNMPTCASAAILRGNPIFGPAWVLLKLASGCRVPWHWHTANEDLVVINGRGTIEMKDAPTLWFAPGAYASLPSHHVHRASCSRACLLFSIADAAFDINYVDDDGRAISLEQALKPTPRPKGKKR